jgi:cation diffusion facilitator CzcD-associated flavoprotein CzcO
METTVDVAVIGAGQAGLASAYFLQKAGFVPGADFVVFDHSPRPGGAWQFRWPTLTFATVHGVYQLPGMSLTDSLGAQELATPVADAVPQYFAAYERRFDLQVQRPVHVRSVRDDQDRRLLVDTDAGQWTARALINATGTWDKPFWPHYPGQWSFKGRQIHTVDYRGPDEFKGLNVVVVGGGASGIQLLTEIASVATSTLWVTRREPEFTDRRFDAAWGRAVEARVADRVRRGLPPESVVKATETPRTPVVQDAIAAGVLDRQPMFDRLTPDGVAWDDGRVASADVIVWATGFRAALDHLAPLRLRRPGGGVAVDNTRALDDPRVFFVGYGPSASTIGANRAGRVAVRAVTDYLNTLEPVLVP